MKILEGGAICENKTCEGGRCLVLAVVITWSLIPAPSVDDDCISFTHTLIPVSCFARCWIFICIKQGKLAKDVILNVHSHRVWISFSFHCFRSVPDSILFATIWLDLRRFQKTYNSLIHRPPCHLPWSIVHSHSPDLCTATARNSN